MRLEKFKKFWYVKVVGHFKIDVQFGWQLVPILGCYSTSLWYDQKIALVTYKFSFGKYILLEKRSHWIS